MSHYRRAEYRADYIVGIIRAIIDVFISAFLLTIYYSKGFTIAGWTIYESLLVYGIFQFIWAGIYTVFGASIKNLFADILEGNLDLYLSKPLDSQFAASVRLIFITSNFRVLFSLGIIFYSISKLSPQPEIFNILLGTLAVFSSYIIYYSLIFLAAISAFWTMEGSAHELTESIATIARFPADFYSKNIQKLITFIPMIFISTVPAMAITGKNTTLAIISPVVAVVLFIVTRYIWHQGLKSYSSASS